MKDPPSRHAFDAAGLEPRPQAKGGRRTAVAVPVAGEQRRRGTARQPQRSTVPWHVCASKDARTSSAGRPAPQDVEAVAAGRRVALAHRREPPARTPGTDTQRGSAYWV